LLHLIVEQGEEVRTGLCLFLCCISDRSLFQDEVVTKVGDIFIGNRLFNPLTTLVVGARVVEATVKTDL
jgi:hypothetical protein